MKCIFCKALMQKDIVQYNTTWFSCKNEKCSHDYSINKNSNNQITDYEFDFETYKIRSYEDENCAEILSLKYEKLFHIDSFIHFLNKRDFDRFYNRFKKMKLFE